MVSVHPSRHVAEVLVAIGPHEQRLSQSLGHAHLVTEET